MARICICSRQTVKGASRTAGLGHIGKMTCHAAWSATSLKADRLPALSSLEPIKLPCQVSSSCKLSPLATAARSASVGCFSALGGGVNCTLLPMERACQGAVAGVDMAEPGLLKAAQSPAHHDAGVGVDLWQGETRAKAQCWWKGWSHAVIQGTLSSAAYALM